MSRSRRIPRWTAAALLAGAVGIGAAGCVAVPVGGYGGYGGYPDPAVVFPVPGLVIAPPPVIYRQPRYGGRGYGGRGGYSGRGYNRWRG